MTTTEFTYTFKDSETEQAQRSVLIAVAGPTGGGKTETAIRIARGYVGPQGRFCIIDTDNRRALNKRGRYRFGHFDMPPPYSPEHFEGAIRAAISEGFGAIIIDHFSAEWDGEGGLSDIADEIIERRSRGDTEAAERMTAAAWKAPKLRHKKLMRFMRASNVPIILALRAEPKIKFVEEWDERKKKKVTKVIDAGWLPIAEKMLGYDMLIYALMMADNPGVAVHLKKLEPELEPLFPAGAQITEDAGRMLAAWARGETIAPSTPSPSPLLRTVAPNGEGRAEVLEQLKPWSEDRDALSRAFGTRIWSKIERMPVEELQAALAKLQPTSAEAPSVVGEPSTVPDTQTEVTPLMWAQLGGRAFRAKMIQSVWEMHQLKHDYASAEAAVVALESQADAKAEFQP